MKKRKLIVGGVIGLIIVIGLVVFIVVRQNKNDKVDTNNAEVLDQSFVDLDKAGDEYDKKETARIEELANTIKTTNDLKALGDGDQVEVGVLLIQKLSSSNKGLAKEYAAYLMQRDDAYGLDASMRCYELSAGSTDEQSACKKRASEQARAQKIIGPNDELPASYFEPIPESEQQG